MKKITYLTIIAICSAGTMMAMTPEQQQLSTAFQHAAHRANPAAIQYLAELGGAAPAESSTLSAAQLQDWLIGGVKSGQFLKVEAALEAGAHADTLVEGVPLVVLAARQIKGEDPSRMIYKRITKTLLRHGGAKGLTAQEILSQIPDADARLQKFIKKYVK